MPNLTIFQISLTQACDAIECAVVAYVIDIPRDSRGGWLFALLHAIKTVLQVSSVNDTNDQLPANFSDWHVTSHAVQFTYAGLDVDVMVTSDWNTSGTSAGYDALFDVTCEQKSVASRQWYVDVSKLKLSLLCHFQ